MQILQFKDGAQLMISADMKKDFLESAIKLNYDDTLSIGFNHLYLVTLNLMQVVFYDTDNHLPKEHLFKCVSTITKFVTSKNHWLLDILKQTDKYTTYQHSVNVAFFSGLIGQSMQMSYLELFELIYAALLHDIGKKALPSHILDKECSLAANEFEIVKKHPLMSVEILENNGITEQTILSAVKYHHERSNNSGYPDGLSHDLIPINSRIIAIADVFDALISNKTYLSNYSTFDALKLMKQEMAHELDIKLLDKFIQLYRNH